MYSNCKGVAAALLVGCSSTFYSQSNSAQPTESLEMEMIAQPSTCVALTQGRTCYAEVKVSWRTNMSHSVCLHEKNTEQPIFCWEQQQQGDYIYELESSEDVTLSLRTKSTDVSRASADKSNTLAMTTIKVSWLYQVNTRKRRWRLF